MMAPAVTAPTISVHNQLLTVICNIY